MAAPIALEIEVAGGLGVDLRIEIVLLGPERIRRIEVLEILHQPGAVELACANVAGERREPAPAQYAAAVAHRILAAHARPIRQRRTGDDDRAEQLRSRGGEHHQRPPGLAVADDARLGVGVRVQLEDLFDKNRLGAHDILDGLARHGIGPESHEITGMSRFQRNADFAVCLEAADPGAMPSAWIDDHEGTARQIDLHALRRHHAREAVVHRPRESAAVHHQLYFIVEYVGDGLGHVFAVLLAALAHHVPEQHAALGGVDQVFPCGIRRHHGQR